MNESSIVNRSSRAFSAAGGGLSVELRCSIIDIALMSSILYLATLRGNRVSEIWTSVPVVLWGPVQKLREYSLWIIAVLLIMLAVVNVFKVYKAGSRVVVWPILLLAIFNFYIALRDYSYGYIDSMSFMLAIGLYVVLFLAFGLVVVEPVGRVVYRLSMVVVVAFYMFAVSSLIELRLNPDNVYWNGRFNGVTSHPVFCGVISALGLVSGMHLFLDKNVRWFYRAMGIASVFVGAAFLYASGTRTGVVITAIACLGLVRQHFSKFLFIAGTVAAGIIFSAVYVVSRILNLNNVLEDSRVLSTENTRSDAWLRLWDIFVSSPLVGTPGAGGENSYLLAAASGGLLGVIPFGACIIMILIIAFQMKARLRDKRQAGVLMGFIFMFLCLGVFEGYMLDLMTFPLVCLILTISGVAAVQSSLHPMLLPDRHS